MLGKPCILMLSQTCLINSIKHELSCKILYEYNILKHYRVIFVSAAPDVLCTYICVKLMGALAFCKLKHLNCLLDETSQIKANVMGALTVF